MSSKLTDIKSILSLLHSMESPENCSGMSRFGINVDRALGIKVTDLRKLARRIEKGHDLALELWDTGIHEARLLATMIDLPAEVTAEQMEQWAADFNSWDIVDQACNNLFRNTLFAHTKVFEWTSRDEEFIKRAGFALMAVLAVHDHGAEDSVFQGYLDLIKKGSFDERNFVKKAVNWALRQIGKRNSILWKGAMTTVEVIAKLDSKSARWVAADGRRELSRVGKVRRWE